MASASIIYPGIGLNGIRFGSRASEVVERFGRPSRSWTDEDGDEMLEYEQKGVAFFAFDHEEGMRLVSFEVTRASDAELWGERIFRLSLRMLMGRVKARGLELQRVDESGGTDECLFRVRGESLDFYYSHNTLSAITAGVIITADDKIRWPEQPASSPKSAITPER